MIVLSYPLDELQEFQGVGTENCIIADIQRAFRCYHDDDMAGERTITPQIKYNKGTAKRSNPSRHDLL